MLSKRSSENFQTTFFIINTINSKKSPNLHHFCHSLSRVAGCNVNMGIFAININKVSYCHQILLNGFSDDVSNLFVKLPFSPSAKPPNAPYSAR
ncbi:hypothetical protein [Neisseria sicca]|uniref:hypothetical protein n=1 Tax=Neisseria sicca TaxID=490 RepID=UPI0002F86299|nr:hypothetical protein [Neisseria sicca]